MQLANKEGGEVQFAKLFIRVLEGRILSILRQSLKTAAFYKFVWRKLTKLLMAHVLQNDLAVREVTLTTKPSTPTNHL